MTRYYYTSFTVRRLRLARVQFWLYFPPNRVTVGDNIMICACDSILHLLGLRDVTCVPYHFRK